MLLALFAYIAVSSLVILLATALCRAAGAAEDGTSALPALVHHSDAPRTLLG